jgi:hypothetical protein
MKHAYLVISLIAILFSSTSLNAQQPHTPLFGKDIVIQDQPDRDQRNIEVCSAPNGWLYACYWNPDESGFSYYIMRSTDDGISWSEIANTNFQNDPRVITEMDIIACGDNESNIKVFIGIIIAELNVYFDQGVVLRFNGLTGEFENEILNDQEFTHIHDIALATDYPYPVPNASPYSLAVIYSKNMSWTNIEKLVFCSSSNGGLSFDHSQEILSSTSTDYFHVDLAYAWSPSKNSGRYFAVWEEKEQLLDPVGHIYTAHTEPNFDSPFTKPVCLDSLTTTTINKCRLPAIACQVDEMENENSDITQLVLFESVNSESDSHDIVGYFNTHATSSTSFSQLSVSDSLHHNLEPDVAYNNYDHSFMVTYFDSSVLKLPLISNDLNLVDPNSWNAISSGYNDSDNLSAPYPSIKMNSYKNGGMNAWIAERANGNGIARFDAPYSTYTGPSQVNPGDNIHLLGEYPDPCSDRASVWFYLNKPEQVSISLYTIAGKPLGVMVQKNFPAGRHSVEFSVSAYPPGIYLYTYKAGNFSTSGKLSIVH